MVTVTSKDKDPVEQAVELVVYAPIGLALEARRLLPTFVERGRQQVQMARMIGKFAVKQGQNEAERRLSSAQAQAESLLGEFGLGAAEAPMAGEPVVELRSDPDAAAPERSGAAATELAIADYDSLAASQVIPRLTGLTEAELEAVRDYEAGHRGRKTILGKVAQIQGS